MSQILAYLRTSTDKQYLDGPRLQILDYARSHQLEIVDFQPPLLCDDPRAASGMSRTHFALIKWALLARMLNQGLRLAHEKGWLSAGQYQHVSAMVAEIGRLLGGWIKQTGGRT